MRYTYQQLEVIRERALALGIQARWHGEREEHEAWLRVSRGISEIEMIWFVGRPPFLRVAQDEAWRPEIRGCSPLDLVHTALELVALHAALTADLVEPPPPARCERCGVEIEGSGICAKCDSEPASFWASVEVPL